METASLQISKTYLDPKQPVPVDPDLSWGLGLDDAPSSLHCSVIL